MAFRAHKRGNKIILVVGVNPAIARWSRRRIRDLGAVILSAAGIVLATGFMQWLQHH